MCGVRPVDISEHERARLDDAVDDARIEREVVYAEGFVQVRECRRESVRQPMPRVEVELLQLVVHVGELIGRRNRAARRNRVEVLPSAWLKSYENRASVLPPIFGGVA